MAGAQRKNDAVDYGNSMAVMSFKKLDAIGQEAFFRYLHGHQNSQENIRSFPVTRQMNEDAKRYQFWVKCDEQDWVKCDEQDRGDIFGNYIRDDDTALTDLTEALKGRRADITKKAKEIYLYILELKGLMEGALNTRFNEFQTHSRKASKK